MEMSAREQELACKDNHAAHLKMIEEVADAPGILPLDKVCLIVSFSLSSKEATGSIGDSVCAAIRR